MISGPAKPLAGRRILITRAREKERSFGTLLEELGAEAVQIPLVRIEDPESWRELEEALARLENYQRIVFTSATAVHRFFARLRSAGVSLPAALAITKIGRAHV